MFYMGLGASLREGLESYLYMIPLGGAYESKNIPLPAVLGEDGYRVHLCGVQLRYCRASPIVE